MTPQEYQMLMMQQQQQAAAPAAQPAAVTNPNGHYAAAGGDRTLLLPMSQDLGKDAAAQSATIGAGLTNGLGFRSADGKGMINPTDYMKAQAANGTPIGQLYTQASGQGRENAIMSAGRGEQQQYLAGSQALASGQTGRTAMDPAQSAAQTLSTSGNGSIQAGTHNAQQAANTAAGMSGDIAGLRQAAAGNVPSAAQIQQRQGVNDAINSQASLAASARGGNLASSMRTAAAAGQGIQAQGIANNSALRANEMATARGQLTQATGTQGQLFDQAGGINNSLAQTQVGRDNGVVQGNVNIGSQVLGSQMAGVTGVGNAGQTEQGRVGAAIANDRQDLADQNNYLLQVGNQGMGFAAQNYSTDTNAATQQRAQNLQLVGSAAAGIGSTLANIGMSR